MCIKHKHNDIIFLYNSFRIFFTATVAFKFFYSFYSFSADA